jgi:hypothetical protein
VSDTLTDRAPIFDPDGGAVRVPVHAGGFFSNFDIIFTEANLAAGRLSQLRTGPEGEFSSLPQV